MKFIYEIKNTISPLAWCARIKKESENILVKTGRNVEINNYYFFEGAWDGNFEDTDFENATFFCGSGAKIQNSNRILFSTPNHVLEKIVLIKTKKEIIISNSIPFLLSEAKLQFDINYLNYEKDFNSILNGINNYKRDIPLRNDKVLECYYYCNIVIDNNLDINIETKKHIEPFRDYKDYYTRLMQSMKKIGANASNFKRNQRYGTVTTVSKGYDSSACAVVAKKIGCKTACTFNKPDKYKDDDGSLIAEILGYETVICKDASHYLKNTELIEAEHVCSGELGTTIIFEAFENEFKNNLVYYGERGDKIWNKNWKTPNNEFEFLDECFAGISMGEWRLRVGFILVPLPLYGGKQWTSIHKISNSEEMEKWSIGGDYDRPIPRRMVEENGVGRELFGIAKKGAGFNYKWDNLKRIKSRMSDVSYNSFLEFYKENKRKGDSLKVIIYYLNNFDIYINYVFRKLHLPFDFKTNNKRLSNPGAASYLINWGVDEMIKKYK